MANRASPTHQAKCLAHWIEEMRLPYPTRGGERTAPESVVRRVDHPHRAVHGHVSLPTVAEAVLKIDFHPLPHAVGEGDAGPKLRCGPPSSSVSSSSTPTPTFPVPVLCVACTRLLTRLFQVQQYLSRKIAIQFHQNGSVYPVGNMA